MEETELNKINKLYKAGAINEEVEILRKQNGEYKKRRSIDLLFLVRHYMVGVCKSTFDFTIN